MRPVLLVKPFAILNKSPQVGLPPLSFPDFGVNKQNRWKFTLLAIMLRILLGI